VERYIENAPVNVNLMYSLAGMQFHLGWFEKARPSVQRILELRPDHPGALELSRLVDRYLTGRSDGLAAGR